MVSFNEIRNGITFVPDSRSGAKGMTFPTNNVLSHKQPELLFSKAVGEKGMSLPWKVCLMSVLLLTIESLKWIHTAQLRKGGGTAFPKYYRLIPRTSHVFRIFKRFQICKLTDFMESVSITQGSTAAGGKIMPLSADGSLR